MGGLLSRGVRRRRGEKVEMREDRVSKGDDENVERETCEEW